MARKEISFTLDRNDARSLARQLADGMAVESIAKYTGLSTAEIDSLR